MLALLLLAQVSSVTPAPTPGPVLGAASASVSGRPKTLADLARERKLGKQGVAGGTLSVSGKKGMPPFVQTTNPEWSDPRTASAGPGVSASPRGADGQASGNGNAPAGTASAQRKPEDLAREVNDINEMNKGR